MECPNKRVMIMLDNGEVQSEDSDEEMPPLEDESDCEYDTNKLRMMKDRPT